MADLIERLRQAAAECSGWDPTMNAPYNEWSDLMDEAATALEANQPTDWPAFAGDMLSDDPERLRQHMPPWLLDIVDKAAMVGPDE